MPVHLTQDELKSFYANGATEDSLRSTINAYRNQGLNDEAIRGKIDERLSSWNTPSAGESDEGAQVSDERGAATERRYDEGSGWVNNGRFFPSEDIEAAREAAAKAAEGADYRAVKAGMKGAKGGVKLAGESAINAGTLGAYGWLNKEVGGDYRQRKTEARQAAEAEGLGGALTAAELATDIGASGLAGGKLALGAGQKLAALTKGAKAAEAAGTAAPVVLPSAIAGGLEAGTRGAFDSDFDPTATAVQAVIGSALGAFMPWLLNKHTTPKVEAKKAAEQLSSGGLNYGLPETAEAVAEESAKIAPKLYTAAASKNGEGIIRRAMQSSRSFSERMAGQADDLLKGSKQRLETLVSNAGNADLDKTVAKETAAFGRFMEKNSEKVLPKKEIAGLFNDYKIIGQTAKELAENDPVFRDLPYNSFEKLQKIASSLSKQARDATEKSTKKSAAQKTAKILNDFMDSKIGGVKELKAGYQAMKARTNIADDIKEIVAKTGDMSDAAAKIARTTDLRTLQQAYGKEAGEVLNKALDTEVRAINGLKGISHASYSPRINRLTPSFSASNATIGAAGLGAGAGVFMGSLPLMALGAAAPFVAGEGARAVQRGAGMRLVGELPQLAAKNGSYAGALTRALIGAAKGDKRYGE
ncbi:hypothetical protein FACS1894186_4940 [Alphaproteobacteria bacterium]|nr:hypothetical protein FACS1894186_4940 [Alphaproteobacteria bacterium]